MKLALVLALLAADSRVKLETVVARDRYYVGEPIPVTLRVTFDREFFDASAVQLFQRELEVPLQVAAPWLDDPAPADGPTIALNDAVVRARAASPGVLEIDQTLVAREPGELVLSAPRARYAFATAFTDDFIQGRIPADRHERSVEGAARVVPILPLPDPKPDGFRGAVGTALRIRADARPRMVAVGAIVKLTLTIEGEGNLEDFEAPRLDRLDGFHVYGVLDEKSPTRRVITYDLAPLNDEVEAVPPIAFAWFDGPTAGYVVTTTTPIPLAVHGDRVATPAAEEGSVAWIWICAGVAALGGLWIWSRRRRAPRVDHAAEFRMREDVPDAFVDYLAARLGCPPAAVISPGLAGRLAEAGVPDDLAGRVAALVEEMVASRYGGTSPDDRVDRARALVEALEASGASPA